MKLLIITQEESELSRLLFSCVKDCSICASSSLPAAEVLEQYDAFVVLGSNEENPLILWQDEMILLEAQLKRGARIFLEYTFGLSTYHSAGTNKTRYARPVLTDNTALNTDFAAGTLFDKQSDIVLPPTNWEEPLLRSCSM